MSILCISCHATGTLKYLARGLQEPFNLNKVDDHGNTLLMVAAQNGNLKMSKLFVYKGANPNHQVRGVGRGGERKVFVSRAARGKRGGDRGWRKLANVKQARST